MNWWRGLALTGVGIGRSWLRVPSTFCTTSSTLLETERGGFEKNLVSGEVILVDTRVFVRTHKPRTAIAPLLHNPIPFNLTLILRTSLVTALFGKLL